MILEGLTCPSCDPDSPTHDLLPPLTQWTGRPRPYIPNIQGTQLLYFPLHHLLMGFVPMSLSRMLYNVPGKIPLLWFTEPYSCFTGQNSMPRTSTAIEKLICQADNMKCSSAQLALSCAVLQLGISTGY